MAPPVRVGGALFWLGLAFLLAAGGFLVSSRAPAEDGFGDLARVVGAMVLAALAGATMSGFLVAWRLEERTRPARWRLGAAVTACIFAVLAAGKFLAVAWPEGNLPLAILSALIVLASLVGLALSGNLWRRPTAR